MSAAAGRDYVHTRGRAFFEDGQVEARVLVEVLGSGGGGRSDDAREGDQLPVAAGVPVFKVVLSDPQGVSY